MLKEVEYSIAECCGMCLDGKFEKGSLWGICELHEYSHLKHSDSVRSMSISLFGRCCDFKMWKEKVDNLGRFKEFVNVAG